RENIASLSDRTSVSQPLPSHPIKQERALAAPGLLQSTGSSVMSTHADLSLTATLIRPFTISRLLILTRSSSATLCSPWTESSNAKVDSANEWLFTGIQFFATSVTLLPSNVNVASFLIAPSEPPEL